MGLKTFLNNLLISLSLVAFCIAARSRSRAVYGEFCDNRTIRCDSSLSLTCKNQTCICMKPENMIYDSERGACAALAGEKCRYTILEEYRSWQEEILCLNHAHCDFTQNICKCDKDFIELSNGSCRIKSNVNESCEQNSDCKQDYSLICLESKCVCNPNSSEYSDEFQQCVGLANEPCVNDLCTANAICREEPRRIYYGGGASFEVEDSSDEDYSELLRDPASVGRCQCRTAFGVTNEGKCKLGYGGKCDHHQANCMKWLKCKEGTCVCKYPSHQVYDKTSESCLSYIGGPCTNPDEGKNTTKIGCIQGAICLKVGGGGSSRYQCRCPAGYIENMDRACDLDYGSKCSTQQSSVQTRQASSASSNSFHNVKCDRIGKLYCIDGRCQCEDDLHTYDQSSKTCKGLVGATCNTRQKDTCISGAHCKARRGHTWNGNGGGRGNYHANTHEDGICTCVEYYQENEDGTCSIVTQQNDKKQLEQPTSLFTLKSGGSSDDHLNGVAGRGALDKKFNATANSIWAIFDETEET